jgi:predicted ABC-type ATPase
MFAGPNGSGKSVLKSYLPASLLGVYLNPDEIEAVIRKDGGYDFRLSGVETTAGEVLSFFTASAFLHSAGLGQEAARLSFTDGRLDFRDVEVNAYFASVLTEFLRRKLVGQRKTFTFETVMSHPDKISLLADARRVGYRTYLYYVATDDPVINVSRVANRVALGGHPVPEDKIVSRYYRSLQLLMNAISHTSRAYIFDNSTDSANLNHTWIAEITEGRTLELKTNQIPAWFKRSVLDKIG